MRTLLTAILVSRDIVLTLKGVPLTSNSLMPLELDWVNTAMVVGLVQQ